VEECYREVVDNNAEGQVILLDAKAAFDKVIHSHMERRVYKVGIDDKHWVLIKSLHENAESSYDLTFGVIVYDLSVAFLHW
jgi:hypothetical protein